MMNRSIAVVTATGTKTQRSSPLGILNRKGHCQCNTVKREEGTEGKEGEGGVKEEEGWGREGEEGEGSRRRGEGGKRRAGEGVGREEGRSGEGWGTRGGLQIGRAHV